MLVNLSVASSSSSAHGRPPPDGTNRPRLQAESALPSTYIGFLYLSRLRWSCPTLSFTDIMPPKGLPSPDPTSNAAIILLVLFRDASRMQLCKTVRTHGSNWWIQDIWLGRAWWKRTRKVGQGDGNIVIVIEAAAYLTVWRVHRKAKT